MRRSNWVGKWALRGCTPSGESATAPRPRARRALTVVTLGMPDAPLKVLLTPSREERFWSHVDRSGEACWLWGRARNGSGYGVVRHGEGGATFTTMAHRAAWIFSNRRAIPDGMTIDHLCSTRACCNPRHLRVVTHSENVRASSWYRAGVADIERVGPKGIRLRGSRYMVHWREYLADGSVRQAGKTFATLALAIEAHPDARGSLTRQHMSGIEGPLGHTE